MFGTSTKEKYLRWREINGAFNNRIVASLSRSDLMDGARNLGLKEGRNVIRATEAEFDLLFDHCIYDLRRRDGRNAVQRFAPSATDTTDDQRRVLDQMRQVKFRLLVFYEDPDDIVFNVTDLFRLEEIEFIDIGLSSSAREGSLILGHTIPTNLEGVWATTGAMLPIRPGDFEELLPKLQRIIPKNTPRLANLSPAQWSEIARLSLRTALKNGCAERVEFRSPEETPRLHLLNS